MLPAWAIWLILCGIFFILEIFTVTFMMFWPGVAAFVSAMLAVFGAPIEAQIIVFSVLSIVLIIFTKPLTNKLFKSNTIVNTNIDNIVGKEGKVVVDVNNLENRGQVKVGGEVWTAISDDKDVIPSGTTVKVTGIDGVKLIIHKI